MAKKKSSYGYGKYFTKRPMWEWVVIYVVIGLVLYAAVYFFIIRKPNMGSNSMMNSNTPTYSLPGY